jgi:Flp pilus assembly protein TadD
MGDVWIQLLTRTPADLELLNSQLASKVMAEDVIGYERVIQSEPSSVALHDDVAMLYLRLGRPKEAVAHFERSLALNPGAPATHFNLGTALTVAGRLDEALVQYQEALRLRPDYAQAHNNLSGILLQRGQLAEAVSHIAEARRLDPVNVEARKNAALAVRLAERAAQERGGTDPAANAVLTAARGALARDP